VKPPIASTSILYRNHEPSNWTTPTSLFPFFRVDLESWRFVVELVKDNEASASMLERKVSGIYSGYVFSVNSTRQNC